ncbi:class I SAM-dependent DNA methyltransferase [Sphingomonas sp. 2R-10]|uniref:class I SAM-dependent DNA methyltransferase n=1 Tax=Sphingomonas sp. 2R-10 TaxID=3045148 RepID=UPI000F77CF5B|nr:class I SAM-dependent DNA methyltransferase [Sphingomonas sp. 2R-10]MDJ0278535.1 class I SAM-dependent DNA methyltransferase [Sphingomonas sp. 2R-10]
MSSAARQIVQKLWSYCSILRDDGLSYPDYVEQLTYLLFLKMAQEQAESAPSRLLIVPTGFDWPSLVSRSGSELQEHYDQILQKLGTAAGMLGLIFRGAQNKIRDPAKLRLLIVDLIDQRNWSALDVDVKGDAYEGLLERNAQDTKSGAGQYFTPRPVVDAVVECVRPALGQTIYDPACGTGGFLIAAFRHLVSRNPELTASEERHLKNCAISGTELVPAVTRLGAMNLLLHGIGSSDGDDEPPIRTADSLAVRPDRQYDVILTNPPFGKRSSVNVVTRPRENETDDLDVVRDDLWVSTSNKELNFLQHVANILAVGGRAAIVVPEGVLSGGGPGEAIRRRLLQEFDVHTLLRLPPGIFYAQGVNANVLFFDRASAPLAHDRKLWIYDLRTAMRFSLASNRLEQADLEDFVTCFRPDDRPNRKASWSPEEPAGRWRAYDIAGLLERDKAALDISWISERSRHRDVGPEALDELTGQIIKDLTTALEQMTELAAPQPAA